MKRLSCAAVRRRVQAFHDDELPVDGQIAVSAHLASCDACMSILTELRAVRAALRASAPARDAVPAEDIAGLEAVVVSRVRAEQALALTTRVRTLFEDMHFVYAGLAATTAALACAAIMTSMMRFVATDRPGSLIAMMNLLDKAEAHDIHLPNAPALERDPFVVDARIQMRWALDEVFVTSGVASGADDGVITLAAVVSREGRVQNLELLPAGRRAPPRGEAKAVEELMDAVSRVRFEPARVAGFPVAVNMVWLVAHTTVRAPKDAIDPAPGAKKRRVMHRVEPVLARMA
jgi:hypothetical protein